LPLLLGLLADAAGYAPVMILASGVMLAGAAIAPRLKEPRHAE
jgi:hypothetical protein